jgi:hypothetical protein
MFITDPDFPARILDPKQKRGGEKFKLSSLQFSLTSPTTCRRWPQISQNLTLFCFENRYRKRFESTYKELKYF